MFAKTMDIEGYELYLINLGFSKYTIRIYVTFIKKVFTTISVFDEAEVKKFLASQLKRGLSHAGVNKYIKTIKRYCVFKSIGWGKNVVELKEQPKPRALFSDTEIKQIIDFDPPPSKYGMLWELLAYTGARPMELINLKKEDIDFGLKVVYANKTKTGAGRIIVIHDSVFEHLQKYVNSINTDLLFPAYNNSNKPLGHNSYKKDFKKRLTALNINKPVKPYSLRHSFISNTLANKADMFAIQNQVGHRRIETTEKYKHNNLTVMREAVHQLPLGRSSLKGKAKAEQLLEYAMSLKFNENQDVDYAKFMSWLGGIYGCLKVLLMLSVSLKIMA